jgi:DNA-binding NarL/FixJ family response regulator
MLPGDLRPRLPRLQESRTLLSPFSEPAEAAAMADLLAPQDPVAAVAEIVVPIGASAQHHPNGSRVLVIGTNLLITEALVSALGQRGFEPRSAIPAAGTHLEDLMSWRPHVALLQIDPDDMAVGLEFISVLRRAGVAVAIMGSEADIDRLSEFVDAGVSALVDIRSPLLDLISVFNRLTTGDSVPDAAVSIPPAPAHLTRASVARLGPFAVLTAREKCVLAGLMEGQRAESIARTSWVSISTVRTQIKAILQKLGVNSQLAAVAMARDAGWNNDVFDPSFRPANLELA